MEFHINITAILIQLILAFKAKILLFMTFWTNIGPYHMFYIYVTLKIDRTWELSLFSCYLSFFHIHFIMNLKSNNFEQAIKIVLLFKKSLKKH